MESKTKAKFTKSVSKSVITNFAKKQGKTEPLFYQSSSVAKKKDLIDLFLTKTGMTPAIVKTKGQVLFKPTLNFVQTANDFSWKVHLEDFTTNAALEIYLNNNVTHIQNFSFLEVPSFKNSFHTEIEVDVIPENCHLIITRNYKNIIMRPNYYGYYLDEEITVEAIKAYNLVFGQDKKFDNKEGIILAKKNGEVFIMDTGKILESLEYKNAFIKFTDELLSDIKNDLTEYQFHFKDKLDKIKSIVEKSYALVNNTVGFYDNYKANSVVKTQTNSPTIKKPVKRASKTNYYEDAKSIITEFNSYSIDLVKMMKLPLMIDLSEPSIKELNSLVKNLELDFKDGNHECSKETFIELDSLFNSALRTAQTTKLNRFNKEDKKRIKDSEVILSKALNEATPTNEKQSSIKSLISNLDGILPVGEGNLVWLKKQTGLAELTA